MRVSGLDGRKNMRGLRCLEVRKACQAVPTSDTRACADACSSKGCGAYHEAEEGGDDGGVYLVLLGVADRGEPIDLIEEDDRRLVEVRLRPRTNNRVSVRTVLRERL